MNPQQRALSKHYLLQSCTKTAGKGEVARWQRFPSRQANRRQPGLSYCAPNNKANQVFNEKLLLIRPPSKGNLVGWFITSTGSPSLQPLQLVTLLRRWMKSCKTRSLGISTQMMYACTTDDWWMCLVHKVCLELWWLNFQKAPRRDNAIKIWGL